MGEIILACFIGGWEIFIAYISYRRLTRETKKYLHYDGGAATSDADQRKKSEE